jgi:catechol 2,3-dioxygenase-like lactoylglutathione lyase family enzyme
VPEIRGIVDHVSFHAPGSRQFYRRVLATVGLAEELDEHGKASYGPEHDFGLYEEDDEPFKRTHVAILAPSRDAVDRFHAEVLAAGGRSLDAPRVRPEFDPGFYSTYVSDPAGNVVEVLYRSPVPLDP